MFPSPVTYANEIYNENPTSYINTFSTQYVTNGVVGLPILVNVQCPIAMVFHSNITLSGLNCGIILKSYVYSYKKNGVDWRPPPNNDQVGPQFLRFDYGTNQQINKGTDIISGNYNIPAFTIKQYITNFF